MINRKFQILLWLGYLTTLAFLLLSAVNQSSTDIIESKLQIPNSQQIEKLNNKTADIVYQLVKTKFFKILRLNINSECPFSYMNKLCKSKSCSVCRCDEKDIPQNWMVTDKVGENLQTKNKQVWGNQRDQPDNQWVWHVQDKQNDRGQYFDVHFNIQSYSGYNGSYIWSLIYEENCFKGRHNYEQMCRQEKLLYQIISGLHTSISTHLSKYYRNITQKPQWADVSSDPSFFFNYQSYRQRVLNHPQRIKNLLFLYELLIKSIIEIAPYLQEIAITSDNIIEDLHATHLLETILTAIKNDGKGLGNLQNKNYGMFSKYANTTRKGYLKNYLDDHHVKQYQRYIHNISRILNCVECEKCRLFGKMQTYGLGTAMKILLGYDQQLKRNQVVALINTFNKISISVNTYFQYINDKNNNKTNDRFLMVKIWGSCGLTLLIFIYVVSKWKGPNNLNKKLGNAFKNSDKLKSL